MHPQLVDESRKLLQTSMDMSSGMSDVIVVTGAAGFIGSHVCEALVRRGSTVIGIDNFDPFYDRTLKEQNLSAIRNAEGGAFAFFEADICDADAMRSVFSEYRPASVIHLAAKAGVRPSIENPVAYVLVNVQGTSVMLNMAKEFGVKRFVMASSSSVYGNCATVPFHEELDVNQPISPYAATKRATELLAHTSWHLTRMPTACLRFFTVYGPRQRPDLAINKFLRLAAAGKEIPMFGDGSTSRDYTYIDDIVSGVLAALERIDAHGFRIWNLGGNSPVSLAELIATIGEVTECALQIEQHPMQPGDVERTYADTTRSAAELGFAPSVTIEEGIKRQWEWMQKIIL